jgi:small subunit ribosomal protein S9
MTEKQITETIESDASSEEGRQKIIAAGRMEPRKRFFGVGKRKASVVRLYITPGTGQIRVNDRPVGEYFPREALRMVLQQPMEVTGNQGKFDVSALAHGGGVSSQAQAFRHGLARALLALNADYRKPLHRNGFLTRDARVVERKKYGHRKARKSTQYSKR